MILAFALSQKDAGILEYWNDGTFLKSPIFQHSRLPRVLLSVSPLFIITHAHLENRFWTRVIS